MKLLKYKVMRVGLLSALFTLITLGGCKKFIEVPAPITSTNSENVYGADATAIAALTGIYAMMSNKTLTQAGISSMSLLSALSADELTLYNYPQQPSLGPYYRNALTSINIGNAPWYNVYPLIFDANAAIEGLSNSSGLTPAIKQQLLGEAKFIRAFCYFYMVNLYGDIPLVLGIDPNINRLLARTPKTQVYQQIIADLTDAQGLLSNGYLAGNLITTSAERTSPNKWAATALLARTYLYTGDWANAVAQASAVIGNSSLYSLVDLNSVFLKNSNEAIWQLQPVAATPTVNTPDAFLFILPATGPDLGIHPVYLSSTVINSFEAGDRRKSNWTNNLTLTVSGLPTTYYYPYKYKDIAQSGSPTEYEMILRLAEQYLIRAEAEANNNDSNNAVNDLNTIRTRAGLPNYTGATDKASLLTAILHERQVELFTEWGHRWLDLKRTGNVDGVMSQASPQKGGLWNTIQQLYPIPLTDIQTDPNLKQNTGY